MASKKGRGPEPLDPKVARKLLDLLSTDNEFRRLFKQDAHAALVKAGWKAPPALKGAAGEQLAAASGGTCLQMASSDRIAPKAKIIRERAKLEASLTTMVWGFLAPVELQAD